MTQRDGQDCRHVRPALGVYLLGAIDPAERSAVDEHLTGCPDCRGELAGLAGLPALLGRVSADEAAELASLGTGRAAPAVPAVSDLLLARLARQRRVSRWRSVAVAAAVALIAAGGAVGLTRATHHGPGWEFVTAAQDGRHAVFGYAAEPGGTRLEAKVSGIAPGTTCAFWVVGNGGTRVLAGSWTIAPGTARTWYQASAAVPVSQVQGFMITWNDQVLVRVSAS